MAKGKNTKRILIVEDDEGLADLYLGALKGAGFFVEAASDGREGLEKLAEGSYDLVLLDIMLPEISGLEVLKKIKDTPELRGIPVILLTSLGKDAVIKEGFTLGAAGYMVKTGYTPSQVVEEVGKFLNGNNL